MKKRAVLFLGMVMVAGCMAGCGETTEDTVVTPVVETIEEAAGDDAADVQVDEAIEEAAAGDEVYSCDDYSISYSPADFVVSDVRGMIQLLYCNESIQYAGSNEILITKDEGVTADEIANAIAGEDAANISDGSLGSDAIPVKTYMRTSESPEDSSLTLVDSFMVMQCGDGAVTLEIIRTVGQDDEIDMTIEGAFTHTLESFVLNK